MVSFNLKTTDGEEIPITAKIIPQIVPDIKTKKYREAIDTCRSQHPDLDLPTFAGEEMRIHMLLAGGAANALTGEKVVKVGRRLEVRDTRLARGDAGGTRPRGATGRTECLRAQDDTRLGLAPNGKCYISGSLNHNEEEQVTLLTTAIPTDGDAERVLMLEDQKLNQMVHEALNGREFKREEDDEPTKEDIIRRFEESIRTHYTPNGDLKEYEVSLPWKSPDSREKIPENRPQTLAMLRSNARKLEKLGKLSQFHSSVLDLIKEGILREVDMSDPKDAADRTFVPSFGVLNPKSTSTPVRLVVAANLPRNNAVNDQLASSINLLQPLDALIHRWRIHKVGITGDVSRAYYRISTHPDDRRKFNILWYRNPEERKDIMTLELMKLPMGSGPSQGIMCLVFNYHLKADHDQEASTHLRDSLYSDNAVTSLPEDGDVAGFVMRMHHCMLRGGFSLKKFTTNDNNLRETLRAENLYNEAEVETAQVLGLRW